jgi:hypothetical protein
MTRASHRLNHWTFDTLSSFLRTGSYYCWDYLKDRKRRLEGVNGSHKISHEIFGRCPKFTAKHAKQTKWYPRLKWVSECSLKTQWDTIKPTQKMKRETELKSAYNGRDKKFMLENRLEIWRARTENSREKKTERWELTRVYSCTTLCPRNSAARESDRNNLTTVNTTLKLMLQWWANESLE